MVLRLLSWTRPFLLLLTEADSVGAFCKDPFFFAYVAPNCWLI
jgi:hypothetical protein